MANIKQYLPYLYKDVKETDALTYSEELLFDELADAILVGHNNQFITTADIDGISAYETVFGIMPTLTETLEFRRQRLLNRLSTASAFTMKYLVSRLDNIIGAGKYNMYMDVDQPYTLVVESSAEGQDWYQELLITINSVKPANILFINKPLVSSQILANESISYSERLWNYKLGVSWELGLLPFVSYHDQGEVKSMATSSIKSELLNDIAGYTANDVAKVRVNGSLIINSGITKITNGNTVNIQYVIPLTDSIPQVTQIELLDADDKVLTAAPVYIPALTDLTLKHTIQVKEG